MRLFGSDRLTGIVNALGLEDDQPIQHRMLSNAIENAQKRVEGKNFSIRKNVLQFDDVMNTQREIIYAQRRKVLNGENLKDYYLKMFDTLCNRIIGMFCDENPYPDNWDWEGIISFCEGILVPLNSISNLKQKFENITKEELKDEIYRLITEIYELKEKNAGSELMREVERVILLRIVDQKWTDHIDAMDQLKHGIYLRAYGQRDPVIEYKFEGFEMFEEMIKNIQEEAVKFILNVHIEEGHSPKREKVAEPINASHGEEKVKKPIVKSDKIGRNEPCSCGSGKKYKKCCGM